MNKQVIAVVCLSLASFGYAVQAGTLGAQEAKGDQAVQGKVADGQAKAVTMELAGGKFVLQAPAEWKQVTPRFPQMTAYEFNYPADAKAGEAPVRVTVMSSGGGLEGNLQRWYGQFSQPDGKATKDLAKMETIEVAGQKVHIVKITGTYSGGMAPGGRPAQKKENHMLHSGIIDTKDSGMFFVTMTGPIEDCEKLSEGFVKMLKGLQAK